MTATVYMTHWFGGNMYAIAKKDNEMLIFTANNKFIESLDPISENGDTKQFDVHMNPIKTEEITELWQGKDEGKEGTTYILKLKDNSYLFVCHDISSFQLCENDEIMDYKSPIVHNFPFPYIIGKINTYLMFSGVYINNTELINLLQSKKYDNPFYPYEYYYENMNNHQIIQFKHFDKTIIHKVD
jgi:hypothetical protein